jgi:hypothetical protein
MSVRIREIKPGLFLDISVENTKEEELLPESESVNKEKVPSVPKKIKVESTDTEIFEETSFQKKDFIGQDMYLAKLITVLEFVFISKVTPNGFHNVKTCKDDQDKQIYWEHEFILYNTLEDYPKYNRFVLSTFLWITLLGHKKAYFLSGHISFKLKETNLNKDLSNYWLVLHGNQRHPRYNNRYLADKWTQTRLEKAAVIHPAPLTKFTIIDDKGTNLGCPEEDKVYIF